MKQNR